MQHNMSYPTKVLFSSAINLSILLASNLVTFSLRIKKEILNLPNSIASLRACSSIVSERLNFVTVQVTLVIAEGLPIATNIYQIGS